jgi:hypothetical protein
MDSGLVGIHGNSNHPEILFHPKLIEMVENNKRSEITEEWMVSELGLSDIYCGGADQLQIEWIPEGTAFKIDDYDGAESLETLGHFKLIA